MRHRFTDLLGRRPEHPSQLDRLVHGGLDLVKPQVIGHFLDVVDDVVQGRGEREDVLPVDGSDERVVQAIDDVVGDPIAFVLTVADLLGQRFGFRVAAQKLIQELG